MCVEITSCLIEHLAYQMMRQATAAGTTTTTAIATYGICNGGQHLATFLLRLSATIFGKNLSQSRTNERTNDLLLSIKQDQTTNSSSN